MNTQDFGNEFPSVRFSPNVPESGWRRKAGTGGVHIPPIRSDRVIANLNQREIIVVTPDAPQWQVRRAHRVGSYGNRETLFDNVYPYKLPESDTYAFLVRERGRAVGMAVIRTRLCSHHAWSGIVEEEERRLWTVTFVWVLESHRKSGIAEALLKTIAKYFGVAEREIGWLLPLTESGECLARHFCPVEYWGA